MIYYLFSVSLIAFFFTALDKIYAIKNKRRISEKTLLTTIFMGGTIGSVIAMILFKHKTSKERFLLKFYIIVIIQIITISGLLYFDTIF